MVHISIILPWPELSTVYVCNTVVFEPISVSDAVSPRGISTRTTIPALINQFGIVDILSFFSDKIVKPSSKLSSVVVRGDMFFVLRSLEVNSWMR